jgi:hypothetical protein
VNSSQRIVDTLGLSREAHDRLVARFNQPMKASPDGRRTEPRRATSERIAVLCQICDQHESDMYFAVRPRDVSQSGLGFLHGRYIHLGRECVVTFIFDQTQGLRLRGQVAHCDHVQQHVHKVGIRFHEPLDEASLAIIAADGTTPRAPEAVAGDAG